MKRKKLCLWMILLAVALAAGVFCYYCSVSKNPEEMQGGTLVYERNIIHSDRTEC
ncbi:MAG: hypothetical protein MR308_02735 [Lachnospiraceae bacterium]|nr:hypothetical protein [Lachnospiraceae bacterium]